MKAALLTGWMIASLLGIAILGHRKGATRVATVTAAAAIGAALYLYWRAR